MNNLNDIKEIVKQYYVKAGQHLEQSNDAKHAEKTYEEGLSELKKLKLTQEDRQNLRLLRQAFEYAIKSCKALSRGKGQAAVNLIEQSADYAYRYNAAVIARVSNG